MKYTNAKGKRGFIHRDMDGNPFFRVYNQDKTFTDYDLINEDLEIEILDNFAELVESDDGENCYLDCSREVLGD